MAYSLKEIRKIAKELDTVHLTFLVAEDDATDDGTYYVDMLNSAYDNHMIQDGLSFTDAQKLAKRLAKSLSTQYKTKVSVAN